MKILITGGHLTPALAVIEKLKEDEIFYVGRKHVFEGEDAVSLEYQEISKLKIPFIEIKTGRVQRKITKHSFKSLLKVPVGFLNAYRLLKDLKPDVVLTFGSYISVPVGISARFLNIPLVIHEQTLQAGVANKVLSKFANKICISWKSSEIFFPKEKIVLTGNPLRREVIDQKNVTKQNDLIFVSGGSSGSHSVNILMEKIIEKLLENYKVIHQTGDSKQFNDYDRLLSLKNGLNKRLSDNYSVVKFLDASEAAKTIARATLIVGRSGVNTVTELIFLEKPAFLIPLPYGQRNEQLINAKFLNNLGLSEYFLQDELTPDRLYERINFMVKNINNYKLKEKVLIDNPSDKIISTLKDAYKKKTS